MTRDHECLYSFFTVEFMRLSTTDSQKYHLKYQLSIMSIVILYTLITYG